MIWFTSDHHFFHKNIIGYCSRPFADLPEMHQELIHRWNSVVEPEDSVWILGDFSFNKHAKTNEILDQLHGSKNLVKGNHDFSTTKWRINKLVHSAQVMIGSELVDLSHYPFKPQQPDEDTRYLDRRLPDNGQWLLHGHVHKVYQARRKMINVGVDVWDYRPVSLDQILDLINKHPHGVEENQ